MDLSKENKKIDAIREKRFGGSGDLGPWKNNFCEERTRQHNNNGGGGEEGGKKGGRNFIRRKKPFFARKEEKKGDKPKRGERGKLDPWGGGGGRAKAIGGPGKSQKADD